MVYHTEPLTPPLERRVSTNGPAIGISLESVCELKNGIAYGPSSLETVRAIDVPKPLRANTIVKTGRHCVTVTLYEKMMPTNDVEALEITAGSCRRARDELDDVGV